MSSETCAVPTCDSPTRHELDVRLLSAGSHRTPSKLMSELPTEECLLFRPRPDANQNPLTLINPHLTRPDHLVLRNLLEDVERSAAKVLEESKMGADSGYSSQSSSEEDLRKAAPRKSATTRDQDRDSQVVSQLRSFNDPENDAFEPTIFVSWDINPKDTSFISRYALQSYTRWARQIVRNDTDVVMLTHIIMYFITSVPSAYWLYHHFSYIHGILHVLMQVWFTGSYTLMRHQHIHMSGVLDRRYALFDNLFPYVTDPLMGHTWNTYYYHHVKHHHVEGNGPDDLSSTIRYQRDSVWNFLHYLGRFCLLIWFDLPLYFIRKKKTSLALKTTFFELGNYLFLYFMATQINFRATLFTFLIPLMTMRIGLMVGNWGQHAFVDEVEPDSDFRSSITLIDVPSNRYCFNDGYHTSHHLNPRRHWRDHPVSFLQQKHTYAKESALVFRNIDYLMITIKLLQKDYQYLARCLVPIGCQIGMSLEEIAALLETKTRKFSEEEIAKKFKVMGSGNPQPQ